MHSSTPPDVPMARRKCEGRHWGAPCPAYEDGTWPEGCDCYMHHNKDDGDNTLVLALLTLVLAAIGIIALTWIALGADNDGACLTKEQARAKWPRAYLYWHTAQHCWDNQPGRGNPKQPHAIRSVRPSVKTVRWQDYNELDAQADRDTYFDTGTPVPVWRLAPVPQSKFKPWDERVGM